LGAHFGGDTQDTCLHDEHVKQLFMSSQKYHLWTSRLTSRQFVVSVPDDKLLHMEIVTPLELVRKLEEETSTRFPSNFLTNSIKAVKLFQVFTHFLDVLAGKQFYP
jgi:hypothetical protein